MLNLKELLQSERLIIMCCQEYPISPEICYWGGMGTVVKNVSERLVHKGFEVLVTPRPIREYAGDNAIFLEKNGVHVFSPVTKSFQAGEENLDLYLTYPVSEGTRALDHSFTVWKQLEENKPLQAVIHGHDWFSVADIREASKLKLKTVFTVHMSVDRNGNTDDKRIELERVAGSHADVVHYVSLAQQKSCCANNWVGKRQVTISNGVDVTKFVPNKNSQTEDYVLFVGRLTPEKNVPILVKAWRQFNQKFPEVKLKIIGLPGICNTDVMQEIQKLPEALRQKVELRLEMISEQERIAYYQNASVSCFPSSKEAFGIVAVEAQACGVPAVVGAVGGFWENTIEGITGVHVDGTDPTSIAQGLELAYLNRKDWGRNARNFVQQFFNWDTIVEKYIEELYTPLLK